MDLRVSCHIEGALCVALPPAKGECVSAAGRESVCVFVCAELTPKIMSLIHKKEQHRTHFGAGCVQRHPFALGQGWLAAEGAKMKLQLQISQIDGLNSVNREEFTKNNGLLVIAVGTRAMGAQGHGMDPVLDNPGA